MADEAQLGFMRTSDMLFIILNKTSVPNFMFLEIISGFALFENDCFTGKSLIEDN